jgi:hypothetical protein
MKKERGTWRATTGSRAVPDEPTIDTVDVPSDGLCPLLNWNGIVIVIGAAGDNPPPVTTSKKNCHITWKQVSTGFVRGRATRDTSHLPSRHCVSGVSERAHKLEQSRPSDGAPRTRERPASARLDDSSEETRNCSEYCCQVHH